ncbi:LPS export ABC transporter periplasmic protein LptC [Nitrosomonas marina]|uniref:Lipopolysaccharide export system protein LptC n=1 Tax=Nitrosomonas marina TaxID=917 RepID=A0A1H8CCQ7_9PROT|nr:LPS export ABC transporter periplasmic protein LptC [Nitrosomonas marina]SEM91897.1 lipopolysaccharide export system protein LptC [Nitrosomonas marina]
MFRRSNFNFSFIALIGLAALALWLDNITEPLSPGADDEPYQQPDYIVENISGLRMEHAQSIQHVFHAQKMLHFINHDFTKLSDIHFMHLKPDTPPFRVSANQAEIHNNGEDIYLAGNVNVIRGNDDDDKKIIMETTTLHLIPGRELVQTDQQVVITRLNTTVHGTGLEFNNNTNKIELLSRVRAVDR